MRGHPMFRYGAACWSTLAVSYVLTLGPLQLEHTAAAPPPPSTAPDVDCGGVGHNGRFCTVHRRPVWADRLIIRCEKSDDSSSSVDPATFQVGLTDRCAVHWADGARSRKSQRSVVAAHT